MQTIIPFISTHWALSLAVAIVFVLIILVELARLKRGTVQIAPSQAVHLINHENAVVIDIRTSDAFKKGHIIDAQSIALADLQTSSKKLEKWRTKPLILVCNNGAESQKLAALLLKQGYNAYALSGGLRTWMDANLPLIKE